jgi:hypothetical protein
MILATFLLVISTAAPGLGMPGEAYLLPAATVQAQSDQNPQGQTSQGQTTPSQNSSTPLSSKTPSSTAKPTPSKAKPVQHKKKPAAPDCTPAPASSTGAPPSSQTNPPASQNASTNCPPKKVIVREGGSSEPSVQLVGGGGGDQTRSTNQLLESAQENLKKVDGHELSSTQQDSVTQIQQYVQQSKTAAAAGDSDRAHTLAWKAQLLSQELIKPQQ